MRFIADLHTHSQYARACSKNLTLQNIDAWCRVKGVHIVSCADFTHPKWFSELEEKLKPSPHDGLYIVDSKEPPTLVPPVPLPNRQTLFIIGTEVACIYSEGGRVRRVHHCIYAPNLAAARKINEALAARGGKLGSDGRPILGINSKDLLQLILNVDPRCVLIPAHIWTPWFAIFGSFSGFNSMEECFGDYTKYIFALETGLSSDPAMNWRVGALRNFALVSSSDAHSLPNLAREATIFEGDENNLSYDSIMEAIKNASPAKLAIIASEQGERGNPPGEIDATRHKSSLVMTTLRMAGTIEFIPDEGRYHFDGHRACKISMHPVDTKKIGGICPKCKKKMTIGVLSRVEELADQPPDRRPKIAPPFWSLVEFDKLIAEAEGVRGRKSKAVERQYWEFIRRGGNELDILLNFSRDKLLEIMPPIVVEAVMRMREGQVSVTPGYDGEYGVVKIFSDTERKKLQQAKLF